MKAVYFVEKGKLEVREITIPQFLPDEVLVKIQYCALCATDVHLVTNGLFGVDKPLIVGHEMSGRVVAMGEEAEKSGMFRVGDKVTANPVPACGLCPECRRGRLSHCVNAAFDPNGKPMDAMAEYRTYPVSQLFKVPERVPFEYACLVEPITTVSRGIEQAKIPFGSTVCVSGAGSIGLIMVNALRYCGATRLTVIEPVKERRELAKKLGAQYAIDPTDEDVATRGMEITDGLGYDFVFEMSGVGSAAEICSKLVAACGCVEFFAVYPENYRLPVNLFDMFNKEARIQFTFTNPNLYPRSIDLLERLDMDQLVGPVYEIEDAPKAFRDFRNAKYPKLLIRCSKEEL